MWSHHHSHHLIVSLILLHFLLWLILTSSLRLKFALLSFLWIVILLCISTWALSGLLHPLCFIICVVLTFPPLDWHVAWDPLSNGGPDSQQPWAEALSFFIPLHGGCPVFAPTAPWSGALVSVKRQPRLTSEWVINCSALWEQPQGFWVLYVFLKLQP